MVTSVISDSHINRARELIYDITGIYLPSGKDSTIKNRLDKLRRDLKIDDFDVFFSSVKSGKNKQEFINAFTTNKTDFFRENFHFMDMLNRILPHRLKSSEPLKVYCSASSTGEEPYSIATTLLYAKDVYASSTPVSVIATDIDTSVLEVAKKGEYLVDTFLNPLPDWLHLEDYFSVEKRAGSLIKLVAKPHLKRLITFKQLNLSSISYPFAREEFDIIFCRNVLIYFKVEDQEKILSKLFSHLKIGGTMYLGHSESILGIGSKVERLGQNTFVKVVS